MILDTVKEFSTSSAFLVGSGRVVGRLIFNEGGDMIECAKSGGGKVIPRVIYLVGDMQSDAQFILLVERFGPYFRLVQDIVYNRFPCIIMTSMGKRDVVMRLFLMKMKMKMELKLPVLALTDCDPYGFKFLSFYRCGSKKMSNDSAHLTTLDVKWLGVRPSDLDTYKLPEGCKLRMTEYDIKSVKDVLEMDFVKKNPGLVEELTLIVKTK